MKAQNQSEAKLNNRNLITELLIRKAPVSRIELSKITGLSKMTVTNIINELSEEGLIDEVGSENAALGRKPVALRIKPRSKIFLGVYISRNSVHAVAGDLCGRLVAEESIKTPGNKEKLFEGVCELLDKIIKKVIKKKIFAIGVSSVGPLDYKKGVILNPPNFYGIENVEIVKLLEERYNLPVFFDKDTNASALAEWLFGKAKSVSDYIYVGVTNGIGAAIMSEDRLCRGAGGFGGEIGHVTVDLNGKKCSCGNIGCLEMYASIKQGEKTDLEKTCKYLASGLVTLINLFDPAVIYLGHDIALEGERAAKLLEKEVSERYISRRMKRISVEISAFGERSPVFGAFALAVCGYIGKF
jgi:predicted NBD/HSP70 family sugar kinase